MRLAVSNTQKRYTEEEVSTLIELYEQYGTEGLDSIAEIMHKPVRSIRSKLVKEGIYVPAVKVVARKTGPSKKELLNELEDIVGFDTTGFSGATKDVLSSLIVYLDKEQD